MAKQLPCDADGICMACKTKPLETETLHCRTCTTPWHVPCLPLIPTSILDWECSDCSETIAGDSAAPSIAGDLVSAIRAIEDDVLLTDEEKAKKRQELVGGASNPTVETDNRRSNGLLDIFDGSLNCSFCIKLPERPVTVSFFHFPLFISLLHFNFIIIIIVIIICIIDSLVIFSDIVCFLRSNRSIE